MKSIYLKLFTLACILAQVLADECNQELKVNSQQDLDSIRQCRLFTGTITVDQTDASSLKFNGVETLDGSVILTGNNALTQLSFPQLVSVSNQIKLENNRALVSVDFPMLQSVRSFEIIVHPALQALSFPAELSHIDTFTVTDTTITRVDGLKAAQIRDFTVTNNIYLKSVTASNMTAINGMLMIADNSPGFSLDLSSVQSVRSIVFRTVGTLNLSQLSKINGDVALIANSFDEFALSKLQSIDGTLTISNNKRLSKLSFPELTRLGGTLSITDNPELNTIDAFAKLQEVIGTLDVTGDFAELRLPDLNDVRGGLNVQTSSNKFSCQDMEKLRNGVIKGNSYTCKAAVINPKSGISRGNGGGLGTSAASMTLIHPRWSDLFVVLGTVSALFILVF
ncbi:uncharacterized protein BYT42DRAFT_563932 [Radiomyces spectabilis]|uniref:uncharacterized protein n=1 Tax=Radiomyces spectabilis TaxID=64574 RepID=UPI002220A812|nr:uncharacterized protein BYT42DRAFT_563932 [Radiomyces spectabilis]KAI8384879.1 hypothetical protein BYT42DRAFT_563932 [Radiomyces spectabilis]